MPHRVSLFRVVSHRLADSCGFREPPWVDVTVRGYGGEPRVAGGNDILGTTRGTLGGNDVPKRRHRHIDGANHDGRSMLAKAVVALREPGRGKTQIEWTLRGDQGHHRHVAQHVGVRFEGYAIGVSLDPKAGTKRSERIVERWIDVDVDRGGPGAMKPGCAIPPMITNLTSWSIRTRQAAATWSSLSSGGITHQPVPL